MKIAVVGATGLVGGVMLQVLQERGFAECEILAAASPKSVGKEIDFAGRKLTVMSVEDAIAQHPQYAVFSAGASTSRQYAPQFAAVGCTVIDNSSCWRMHDDVPLVVPEINIETVTPSTHIIANPNCSTIQRPRRTISSVIKCPVLSCAKTWSRNLATSISLPTPTRFSATSSPTGVISCPTAIPQRRKNW